MSQKRVKQIKNQLRTEPKPVESEPVMPIIEIIKANWRYLLFITFGTTLLYLNSLGGDFVSDDYATILNNPQIKDLMFGFRGLNPVNIVNYLIALIFGVSPLPYHLLSLSLYLIFGIVAFVLAYLLFGQKVARMSILLFMVHPIHVEAVSWISGKPYLFIAIFTSLSFIYFIYFLEKNQQRFLWWSVVFFTLGFMSDRPRPFSLFLFVGLYLLFRGRREYWQRTIKLIPYAAIISVIFFIIAWPYIKLRIGSVNSGYNTSESLFYNPFFQYPTGLSKYLQLMAFPVDLTLYHTMFIFPAWLNWLILGTYLGIGGYYFRYDKRYFFALAFIFAAILPSMLPVKVSWLVAERYAFLASLGFCLFLGLWLEDLGKRYKGVVVILLSIGIIWAGRTMWRNIDWQTNHKLWVNTVWVSPNSHNAWNNIGDDYDKLKQYENAVKGFTQSTVVKPNYADAYHNRANIFFKMGRLDLARESYEIALSYSPELFQTYLSLVQIDMMERKMDLAWNHAQKAIGLEPNNIQGHYVAAVVLANSGKSEEARKICESIVRAAPQFQPAVELLKALKQQSL
jgi:tetratricopeptide (TPR) repeat protein